MSVPEKKYADLEALAYFKEKLAEVFVELTDTATANSAGIMKLYTSVGTNTDGTLTQNAIKTIYAPLASPALTGTPTAPTAGNTVANTQVATTAFVNNYNDNYVITSAEVVTMWGAINASESSY